MLGPLEVLDSGRPISLASAKQRLLLAALLAQANSVVSVDRLADILWGDTPPTDATAAVQTYVSRLRAAIEPGRTGGDGSEALHTRAPGYLLQVRDEQLDAARFERLVTDAQQRAGAGEHEDATAILDEALSLWRGPAFAEFAEFDFARTEALHLEELRLLAVEARVDARLGLGHHAELIGELEGIVAEHPLRDRPHAQLMLALYRGGREAEALRSYQQHRRYLADELGLEPSSRLVELEAAILRHEPELEWAPGPVRAPASAPRGGGAPTTSGTSRPRVGTASFVATVRAPLVGRRAELDWLARHVDDAAAGEPRIVFVRGDAGIGKSRLARELGREATARGFTVATARCREDLALPYLPLAGSLVPLLEPMLRDDERVVDHERLLQQLLGTTSSLDALPGDDEHERMRLLLTVTQAALELASQRPLFLIVDDIQWIDGPSLELVRHLVLGAADFALREPLALMVLCTHRPGLDANLEADLARLRREECAYELGLHGLTEPEAAELVRVLGFPDADRRLTAAVYEATGGNALFIEAVVKDLRDRGETTPTARDLAVPADLDHALGVTLDRLSDEDRDVLTVAAILGDEVALDDLLRTRPAVAVEHAISEGEALGIVLSRTHGVRFTHPLYAHLLRAAPTPSARHRYRLDVAEMVARADPDGARALEVARHLIEAGDEVDAARLLDAATRGADQAWTLFAWGDAARCATAAVDAAAKLGRSDTELAELHLRAGIAHRRNLDDVAARASLTHAVDAYRRVDDAGGLVSALLELGLVELTSGEFATAIDLVELYELADRLEAEDPGLAARLLAQMATWFTSLDWLERAQPLAERALEIARESSDDAGAVQAEVALATLAWTHLDLQRARSLLEGAPSRARAGGEPWLANQAAARLSLTLLWLGDLADAETVAQRACDDARRTGDWSTLTLALAARLGVATARGEQLRAEQYGDEAWLALRLARYRWGASFVLPALAASRIAAGDLAGAREALTRWRTSSVAGEQDGSVGMLFDVAELFVRAVEARPVELPAWVTPALARWPARVGAAMVPAALAVLAASGACTVADEPLDEALGRIAESGMLFTDGLLFLVPRARGLAALAAGRLDDAAALLSEAISVARAIGADAEGAWAGLDLARALSRAGDLSAAVEQARDAADRAAALGMTPLAAAATAFITDLSNPATRPRAEPTPATAVILFTDLVGSTDLTERVGDAAYRSLADRLDADLRGVIGSCGGESVPGVRLGDGLLALFPSASSALEFAAGAHQCAAALDLSLRIGVHAGDMVRAGDVVSGGAVNVAARVCDAAEPHETLVSETVRSLARTSARVSFDDRGDHRLKGVSDPHHLYAVHPTDH